MENLHQLIENDSKSRSEGDVYRIPVVFHVVYNNDSENLPDSVIFNQLSILNACFRRYNANATETRDEFLDLVGDTRIEFQMADVDPSGMPTNGITRTFTEVEHFGGLLPYGPGQSQQIVQWSTDSLFYNFFRLTNSALGGKNPWDTERYLNIWIGDLRIFEPAFDNFEELVYFALATPPIDHPNWPANVIGQANDFEQGVLLHYVNVGSNNPNSLPVPYTGFNGVTTTGKILVHEVGHYLGLRHIWGDGDCSVDDYIDDTPNSNAESAWNCNFNLNTCTDNIGGLDLPNMVENYMDYSSGDCQNSFTIGQRELMRTVLETFRPLAYETLPASAGNSESQGSVKCFPNPSSGRLNIDLGKPTKAVDIRIQNLQGQVMFHSHVQDVQQVDLHLEELPTGFYLLLIEDGGANQPAIKLLID
jgi:predicted Zn-dependent protease with MMP-like domain